ncbi:hypothetical protein ACR0ST_12455 [Aliidiomarina sp. Khilg15.8]
MRSITPLILLASVFLAGCAASGENVQVPKNDELPNAGPLLTGLHPDVMSPIEAVVAAAQQAPEPVPGQFALVVRAVGEHGEGTYLNSEENYREQTNLTISLDPMVETTLKRRHGGTLDHILLGKTIVVTGEARRVVIHFMRKGRPSGKYYFQTHVHVSDADQIRIVDQGQG